jgi:anti-sigma B factor antagonist
MTLIFIIAAQIRLGGKKVEIIEEVHNDINIYRLIGRLDSNTSQMLEEKVFQAIFDGSKKIIVDFENLDYISSAGLRVVLKANKALLREDGRVILCSMQNYILIQASSIWSKGGYGCTRI